MDSSQNIQETYTNKDVKPKDNKFKNILLIITVVIILLLIVSLSINRPKENIRSNPVVNDKVIKLGLVTPTPFPFQEMTIPYLKERKYDSVLGQLNEISSNESYTSYLTDYKSDGYKINALLTKPVGSEPSGGYPAIIFIHGYIPPTSYDTLQNYQNYVDYLARNGFVVFKIDLRGHGNSQGEANGAYYSSDYIIDVLSAYSALQKLSFVNPDGIGLWGHSMAGNIVLRSLASNTSIPAAVIWAGAVYTYTDMGEYGIDDNSYQPPSQNSERQRKRELLRELYGDYDPSNFFWKQVAATNYLNDVKGSIQLNHAQDDNVVSVEYSRNLDRLLNMANITHEFIEYPQGGHNLTGSKFNEAMENTVRFFKDHLK